MAYDASYTTCKRYKGKKDKPEKSENVQNFYLRRARVDRSDEEMFRNRRSDYGKKPHGDVGIMPVPLTGSIEF